MSCPESEEIAAAPPPPDFSTPTKRICNDGACHGKPDAEGTDVESDSDVQKKFDESTEQNHFLHNICITLHNRILTDFRRF